MKYTLLILCTIFSINLASGQATWRKGSITKNDGTELTGEINDKEWSVNPKEIEFRENGGTLQKYTVHQIKSFSTARPARYEAFAIEYDGDDQNVNRLSTNRSPLTLNKDTLFLRVIVNAQVGLFEFVDANGRIHYFTNQEQGVEELLNRKYKDATNSSLVGVNEKFKQQLLLKAGNCPELHSTIRQLKYNEGALQNLVAKINTCNGQEIKPIWVGETITKKSNLGIVAQVFLSNPEYTFLVADFSEVNFGGGIFYEIYSKKKPNRISLYNELLYKQVNQEGVSVFGSAATIKFSRIKMINSYRFSYPDKHDGRFFWGIGIGTGVRFNTTVNERESIAGYPDYSGSEFELGVMVNAGKTFALSKSLKLNADFRYEIEQSPFGSSEFFGAHNLGVCIGIVLK
ncbi:MAG: hypothetical protein JNJ65_11440 [Cyclobacteriaceae bacterium]|nr:hypothetical protein [Cyclobacteriaceae bacterium]